MIANKIKKKVTLSRRSSNESRNDIGIGVCGHSSGSVFGNGSARFSVQGLLWWCKIGGVQFRIWSIIAGVRLRLRLRFFRFGVGNGGLGLGVGFFWFGVGGLGLGWGITTYVVLCLGFLWFRIGVLARQGLIQKEGLRRTIESYTHLKAENRPKTKREGPSKASIYLGSGRVADTLLWKDKKQTLIALLVLIVIYFNFIASENTIISALTKLLLFTSIFLFIHGILPAKILGYTLEKIPKSWFHLSKDMSHQIALSVASSWNIAMNVLKSLADGNDWVLFFKGSGITFVFIAFYVYEQKEEDIGDLFIKTHSLGCKLKYDLTRKLFSSKKID